MTQATPPSAGAQARLEPDLNQAKQYLAALDPDPKATFTFQTFDDKKSKDRKLAVVRSGKFLELAALLVQLNRRKAGVFVTVNKTNGKGRKAANVVALRALFIDQDDKLGPLARPIALPASIIVRSGGGSHYYWLLKPDERLDRFSAAQARLAELYGTDPDMRDLSRVLRLPGYYHHKGEPKRVELVECHPERRYSIDEVLKAHGVGAEQLTQSLAASPSATAPDVCHDEREFPPADADKIRAGCPFIAHCFDDAEELPESEWFVALGIIGRCENGEQLAHAMSAPYPSYDEDQTQDKLERSREYGPAKCADIDGLWHGCTACPHRGKIKSPIVLGAKPAIKLMTAEEAAPIVKAAMAALKKKKPNAKLLLQQRTFDALAALSDDKRNEFLIQLRELLRDKQKLKAIVPLRVFDAGLKKAQAQRAVAEKQKARPVSVFPIVVVGGRQIRDVSDDALKSLVRANRPPRIFIHGAELAFVVLAKDDNGERLIIVRFTPPRLKRLLSRVADFDSEEPRTGMLAPPDAVVRDVLHSREWPGLPQLNGITSVPILRADGSLHTEPGFDPETGLFYRPPDGFVVPEIPDNPSDDDLAAAVRILFEPFAEFPYTGPSDWAHELALMLTLLVRHLIKGNIPGFAVSANRPGVGKTLHGELPCIIVLGQDAGAPIPPTSEDEEWRKKITAELKMGTALALIDNVMGRLNSPALAAVITCRQWKDRILGVTDAPCLPNHTIWVINGTGLTFGDDTVRRFVRIDMFWPDEHPELTRKFKYPDIKMWARENRPQLLAALLTIVRAWFVRGRPTPPDLKKLGSFEEWATVIGGMLHVAKVPGFLGNLGGGQELNDGDSVQWTRFLNAFFSVYFDEPVTLSDIGREMERGQYGGLSVTGRILLEALPDYIAKLPEVSRQSNLGNRFRQIAGSVFGGFILERAGQNKTTNSALWRVSARDRNKIAPDTLRAYRILCWLTEANWFSTKDAESRMTTIAKLSGVLHGGLLMLGPSLMPERPAEADRDAVGQWLMCPISDSKKRAVACDLIIRHFSQGSSA